MAEDFGMRRLTLNKCIILGYNWLLSSTDMILQTVPDVGPFRQYNYVLLTVLFSPLLLNSEPHSLRCLKGLRKKRQNFQINVLLLQLLHIFLLIHFYPNCQDWKYRMQLVQTMFPRRLSLSMSSSRRKMVFLHTR